MDSYVSDAIAGARQAILDSYGETRERSLALTKLDECELWCERAALAPPIGTSSAEAEANIKNEENA